MRFALLFLLIFTGCSSVCDCSCINCGVECRNKCEENRCFPGNKCCEKCDFHKKPPIKMIENEGLVLQAD